MGNYDWRLSEPNVWKVERMLLDYPHTELATTDARYERLHARYKAYRAAHDDRKPIYYANRDRWTPLPKDRGWPGSSRMQVHVQ